MAFTLKKINVTTKKTSVSLKTLDNVVLLDNTTKRASYKKPVVVLLDENYSEDKLKVIDDYLSSVGIKKSIYISSVTLDLNYSDVIADPKTGKDKIVYPCREELSKMGVTKFYRKHRADIESLIKNGSSIITSGPALYAMLMEDDIYTNHVQQIVFGKPWFTFSKNLSNNDNYRIFPIESFNDLFPVDNNKKIDFWKKGKPCDSYKTKLAEKQFKKALGATDIDVPEIPEIKKIKIKSVEDFNSLFYEPNSDRHEYVAWDLETSGFNFMTDRIGCITLSFDGITGYYISWNIMNDECKLKLNEILGKNKQIGANLKFDVKFLWKNGIPNARIDEDVIIIGHVLDETRSNSLKALAFYYSEFGGYERPLDDYKEKMGKNINYLDIPEDILSEYATMDAIVTYRVWVNILNHLKNSDELIKDEFKTFDNMESYYYYRRIPAVNMYAKIEYEGLYINKDKLDSLRAEMEKYIDDLQFKLFDKLKVSEVWPSEGWIDLKGNGHFDWESSKKLGILLVEKCGWENLGKTESGDYQVTDFQLDRWREKHPEAKDISLMKSLNTLKNGFVGDNEGTKGWPQYMVKHDDGSWRIHANYQAMFTDGGRTKCSNPNFQNIPTRGMYSDRIKGCITSPSDEDYYIVTLDYSALQMRLVCEDCDIGNLSEALWVPGVDMHSHTAFLSFFADKEIDVEVIEVEQDGKKYKFIGGETVLTQRGEVFAKDLKEDDTIVA